MHQEQTRVANRLTDITGGGNWNAIGENDGKQAAENSVSVDLTVKQTARKKGSVPKSKLRVLHFS